MCWSYNVICQSCNGSRRDLTNVGRNPKVWVSKNNYFDLNLKGLGGKKICLVSLESNVLSMWS